MIHDTAFWDMIGDMKPHEVEAFRIQARQTLLRLEKQNDHRTDKEHTTDC